MTLTARVSVLHTVPYSKAELAALSDEKQRWVREYRDEKLVREESLEVAADKESELKQKVLDTCNQFHPKPIIVKTATFPDSFLVGKQYHHTDKQAIFECISFQYNADHPTSIISAINQGVQQELTPEEVEKRVRAVLADKQGLIEEGLSMMAKSIGLETFEQYQNLMKEIHDKALESTNSQEEATRIMHQELDRMYYEHAGKGSYAELVNTKEALYKTTILFRVIGKNLDSVSNLLSYYLRHLGTDSAAISNSIADLVTSFKYPERKSLG